MARDQRPALPDGITLRSLQGAELEQYLDAVAALRIAVFRDWPYLYDGTLAFERDYLQSYLDNKDAVLVAAFDGDRLIGASTSTPMEVHAEAFAAPFATLDLPLTRILYGVESVLLHAYRGLGLGHRFFDLREIHARSLGRSHIAFCAICRPDNHPACPHDYRGPDAFWRKRGYAPVPGAVATFAWRDVGDVAESEKPLELWLRAL
ncbi:MAG: GNAT family N-acetyltransferase [Rhodobacteraceae bacterium]|nr:GNAT family N-acetyltransferase [Paracoccaceae bacterium]